RTIAQVVQSNLKDVGIAVKIIPYTPSTHKQLMIAGYTTEPDPSFSTVWFTCAQIPAWNWTYVCNKQFDAINEAALHELDPRKRTDLYIKLQRLWDGFADMIWLAYPTFYAASARNINAVLRPDGLYLPWAWTQA